MKISLRQLVPLHIEEEKKQNSELWGHEIIVNKNEHLHIVAPSGKGKTSLIHFIYGLRNDYDGQIFYDDDEVKKISAEKISSYRQKNISIIFQDLRLFMKESVFQNIEIKRALNPYHPSEKINRMAQQLGIENKLTQLAGTCSYGEQQRIAIIRALMQPFDFLLLDEPFSHLDEANKDKALALIYDECKQRGAAMIFADLSPQDALKNEKIIWL